jgi:holin-like protein
MFTKRRERVLCITRFAEDKRYAMKVIKICAQVTLLYIFYFIGEWIREILHLSIPGSIVGLLLLLAALSFKVISLKWIETGANILLSYLPFLLIPATVGVMNFTSIFYGKERLLIVVAIISTVVTMIASGHASQLLAKYVAKRKGDTSWKEQSSQSQ